MDGDTSLLVPYEGPRFPRFYFAAVASYFASLSCGFVLGYSSTALVGLRTEGSQLILNSTTLSSWFASLMALGALAGGLAGGKRTVYTDIGIESSKFGDKSLIQHCPFFGRSNGWKIGSKRNSHVHLNPIHNWLVDHCLRPVCWIALHR